jgi:hypothetical protein
LANIKLASLIGGGIIVCNNFLTESEVGHAFIHLGHPRAQAFRLAFSSYLLILPDAAIHTGFYSRRPGNLVFGGKALIILFIILLAWMQWRLVVVQQHREKSLRNEWQTLGFVGVLILIFLTLQLLPA